MNACVCAQLIAGNLYVVITFLLYFALYTDLKYKTVIVAVIVIIIRPVNGLLKKSEKFSRL